MFSMGTHESLLHRTPCFATALKDGTQNMKAKNVTGMMALKMELLEYDQNHA